MSTQTFPDEAQSRSPILKYFEYKHLPQHLQDISSRFYEMAHWIEDNLPSGPERTVALRKLLEAKDAAVRTKV